MTYRTLGVSGLKVSPLCLGRMDFSGPTPAVETIRVVNRALDGSINLIDTRWTFSLSDL